MLDHYDNNEIKTEMDKCKSFINHVLQEDRPFTEDLLGELAPAGNTFMREALLKLGNPKQSLAHMHELINRVCDEIRALCGDSGNACRLYEDETYFLMLYRWETLNRDFIKDGQYDLSKVPELHDMCRYDVLHNFHVAREVLEELFHAADLFADCVVPQEYGITVSDKRVIGAKMCRALMQKIMNDLKVAMSGSQNDMAYQLDHTHGDDLRIRTLGRRVRTRLYFTSESHLYTLLNVLLFPSDGVPPVISPDGLDILDMTSELGYLTQISIRLFDIQTKEDGDPEKFKCEISFSPGAASDPCTDKSSTVIKAVTLTKSINCEDVIRCFFVASLL
jgi:inositol-hexakisphosphate/diphosphoinositol-pentakisphosphate 1-kinase